MNLADLKGKTIGKVSHTVHSCNTLLILTLSFIFLCKAFMYLGYVVSSYLLSVRW